MQPIRVAKEDGMSLPINIDGENCGTTPVSVEVQPKRFNALGFTAADISCKWHFKMEG